MSFSSPSEKSSQFFNNADSFAMAFDSAWKNTQIEEIRGESKSENKLSHVLETLKTHPFMEQSPELAKQVAEFRIRLLDPDC